MKRLAILLGSLLVVGATASAKELVTFEPQEVFYQPTPVPATVSSDKTIMPVSLTFWTEIDNDAEGTGKRGIGGGSDIGEAIYAATDFKFRTENWDYILTAYKAWSYDTDDGEAFAGSRVQIDAMRSFNKDEAFSYKLGTRVRMQNSYDRYYLKAAYAYEMDSMTISGDGYVGYTSMHSGPDYLYSETTPLRVTMYGVSLGYYMESSTYVGENGKDKDWASHELKLAFPLYKSDAINVGFEYTLGLLGTHDVSEEDWYGAGDMHGFKLTTDFPVTANSSVNAYYYYEITDDQYEVENFNQRYGEFGLGWTYKF